VWRLVDGSRVKESGSIWRKKTRGTLLNHHYRNCPLCYTNRSVKVAATRAFPLFFFLFQSRNDQPHDLNKTVVESKNSSMYFKAQKQKQNRNKWLWRNMNWKLKIRHIPSSEIAKSLRWNFCQTMEEIKRTEHFRKIKFPFFRWTISTFSFRGK